MGAFVCVNLFRRTYRRGDLLTIHRLSGLSVQGRLHRRTRRHWVLVRHSIEAEGVLVESTHDRVLVPVAQVDLVEASAS